MLHHPNAVRRAGFTLIEILVVIAIIAILAALITAGVMSVLVKGPEVATRNDILQFSTALDKFYAKYKFYPPQEIKLCANYAQYNTTTDKASLACIGRIWPNLGQFTGVAWAGATPMPAGGIVLEGDQCLVFFLGGPPIGGGTPGLMGGFTLDPRNPISGGADRERFMDFDLGRLTNRATATYPAGHPFPSMIDRSDKRMPYVYFSSGIYGYSATTNSLGVAPYMENATKFHQPTRFQIISAGRDGLYGPGGIWTPLAASSTAKQGHDDMTNFHDNKMGSP